MKNIGLKKLTCLFLVLAIAFTCVAIPTKTVQAANDEAIKITNIKGSTKSIKAGKYFTLKTNYKASKLNFKTSNTDVSLVSSKGTILAKSKGTVKVTISLKKNSKIKKTITVKVTKGSKASTISKKDFDISKFYNGGLKHKGKVYSNYVDYCNAGGSGNYLVTYLDEGDDFTSDGDWKTFKTKRGIKIGDSLTKVLKTYSDLTWTYSNHVDESFDTDEHKSKISLCFVAKDNMSLRFYMDQNDTVMTIFIGY